MPSSITVKTEVFEGPLELLLELIENRKLHISDISLARVTDEYIARINAMGELPLTEASEFVALAATLLLIKSRSLLPTLSLSEEETHDIKELEYRLALYQIIREATRDLNRSLSSPMLWEGAPLEPEPLFVPDKSATTSSLHAAIKRLMQEIPAVGTIPTANIKKAITLEEMIDRLAKRVSAALKLSFRDFSGHGKKGSAEKYDIVVSFLALLELIKQGILRATQETKHGDIMLEQGDPKTPSYD